MANGLTALRGAILQESPIPRSMGVQHVGGAHRLADYAEPLIRQVQPVQSGTGGGGGPANFPLNPDAGGAANAVDVLSQILRELQYMNIPRRPHVRSATATTAGVTLDWSMVGLMDTLMICNYDPAQFMYVGFDVAGTQAQAFVSDQTYALGPNTALNCARCRFYKIGVRMQILGTTNVVSAIAFQSPVGDRAATIA